MLVAIDVS